MKCCVGDGRKGRTVLVGSLQVGRAGGNRPSAPHLNRAAKYTRDQEAGRRASPRPDGAPGPTWDRPKVTRPPRSHRTRAPLASRALAPKAPGRAPQSSSHAPLRPAGTEPSSQRGLAAAAARAAHVAANSGLGLQAPHPVPVRARPHLGGRHGGAAAAAARLARSSLAPRPLGGWL